MSHTVTGWADACKLSTATLARYPSLTLIRHMQMRLVQIIHTPFELSAHPHHRCTHKLLIPTTLPGTRSVPRPAPV